MDAPPTRTITYQARPAIQRKLWQRPGIWIAACVALAVCGVGFLELIRRAGDFTSFETNVELSKPAEIEAWAAFQLPPSASNIRAHVGGFQDHTVSVRFDMSPADAPSFLATTGIHLPLSTSPNAIDSEFSSSALPRRSWWTPGSPAKFETGEGGVVTPKKAIFQRILIDETNPAKWTVWFIAFDT